MKKEFLVDEVGLVVYDESLLSGKKTILVDGKEIMKIGKNVFSYQDKTFTVIGNLLQGISVTYNGKRYEVQEKTKWYEYVLASFAFLFAVIWGNSPSLCAIFPVIGGLIGGGIGGLMLVIQIIVMKSIKNPLLRVIVSLALTVATIFVLYLLAIAFLSVVG